MTNDQFDALVDLMKTIAWHAAGSATHQQRAGDENTDIEYARSICVEEDCSDDLDEEFAEACLGGMANT